MKLLAWAWFTAIRKWRRKGYSRQVLLLHSPFTFNISYRGAQKSSRCYVDLIVFKPIMSTITHPSYLVELLIINIKLYVMWRVLSLSGCPQFAHNAGMTCEWLKPPLKNLCSGLSRYDYIYSKGGVKWIHGSTGKLKMVVLKVQGHGLLQMWDNNTGQFQGSGLKAQEMRFSLCWVSTVSAHGFPCWLRSGGCTGHPYWRFSIVVSPQTCMASKESVVSVYGDDEASSSVLPRLD